MFVYCYICLAVGNIFIHWIKIMKRPYIHVPRFRKHYPFIFKFVIVFFPSKILRFIKYFLKRPQGWTRLYQLTNIHVILFEICIKLHQWENLIHICIENLIHIHIYYTYIYSTVLVKNQKGSKLYVHVNCYFIKQEVKG